MVWHYNICSYKTIPKFARVLHFRTALHLIYVITWTAVFISTSVISIAEIVVCYIMLASRADVPGFNSHHELLKTDFV